MDKLLLLAKIIGELRDKVQAIQNNPPEVHNFVGEKGEKGDNGKNGVDGKDGRDGKDGLNGKDGKDGENGISIISAEITFDNHLVIHLSNGNEIDAGQIQVENRTQYVTQIKGEEIVQYASRYDQVSDVLAYKGEAIIGASDSEALWRIQKLVFGTDGDVTITWVNGNADFRYVWNDRASLTYR
jgi:hypothetical protein